MIDDPKLWNVRPLDRDTNVSDMNCGDEPWGQSVTEFLVNDALEQQEWLINKTTLFYYDQNLVGYVTLAAALLEVQHAQRVARRPGITEMGRDVIPSVLIARFGVHIDHHRKGYGRKIFDWVLAEVSQSNIGARLLILHVDKDNRGGRAFWKANGFINAAGGKNILMWLDLYTYADNS